MTRRSVKFAFAVASAAVGAIVSAQPTTAPTTVPVAHPTSRPSTQPYPYTADIEKFEADDRAAMPKSGGIVFVGSSTIVRWNAAKAFADLPVIERGFGGSRMEHALHYVRRIVTKYQPKVVVLYEGDNDLAAKVPVDAIVDQAKQFVAILHGDCPSARLVICAIKPSGSREAYRDKIDELNRKLLSLASENESFTTFFNDVPLMIDASGKPKAELFREDQLHMNEQGYALWNAQLRPVLERLMKD